MVTLGPGCVTIPSLIPRSLNALPSPSILAWRNENAVRSVVMVVLLDYGSDRW